MLLRGMRVVDVGNGMADLIVRLAAEEAVAVKVRRLPAREERGRAGPRIQESPRPLRILLVLLWSQRETRERWTRFAPTSCGMCCWGGMFLEAQVCEGIFR